MLADPLLAMVASLGQTATLTAGLLLVGYGLAQRGWAVAAGLTWSVLFIKPHLALPPSRWPSCPADVPALRSSRAW